MCLKVWFWYRECLLFILYILQILFYFTQTLHTYRLHKSVLQIPDVPPHVLLPCETDVEIKANVHENISHCTIFSYIFIFPSKFEATTKTAWQACRVLCQRTYKPGEKMTAEMK